MLRNTIIINKKTNKSNISKASNGEKLYTENREKPNLAIIPVLSYTNANKDKSIIYDQNHKKSAIYRINNLITEKSYRGSSVNLSARFANYYSIIYLKNRINKGSSYIYGSMLNDGYTKFSLGILEYCNPDLLVVREQYYIDNLKPQYNILNIAGSRLESKQTKQTRKLISHSLINRVFSEDSKVKMKIAALKRFFIGFFISVFFFKGVFFRNIYIYF